MRQKRGLGGRVGRLEKQAGITRPPEISIEDCYHEIRGATPEEVREKIDEIKARVVQKYGPWALNMLMFVTLGVIESETEKKPRRHANET